MPFAIDLIFILGDVAQKQLILVTDPVGDCFGSALELSLLTEVDNLDLAVF